VASFGESWTFIIPFLSAMTVWMVYSGHWRQPMPVSSSLLPTIEFLVGTGSDRESEVTRTVRILVSDRATPREAMSGLNLR
jgi:hypothetical protein